MFPSPSTRDATSSSALFAIALIGIATWALSHSYLGIFHDAGLYTLQALSHLHPASLTNDVFLRYGSQDRFTVFSPIYAATARLLGIEEAAALLTLVSQAALVAGAFALARAVLPAPLAFCGIAVLIAIPGDYGADRIFTCMESFLTPRMASEALTLAGLAAALASRRVLAGLLIGGAALIHPIMAGAGIAVLLAFYVAIPRPRLALLLAAAALIVLTLQAFLLPIGPWGRFDSSWLSLIQNRSPYLFVAHWSLDDWSRAAVSLVTLTIGAQVLPSPASRMLSRAVLIAVLGGFALTAVACDLLHLVLFTQLQPWRWQWLGTVAAALLLAPALGSLWKNEIAGRSGALLLAAAWIFASNAYALVAAGAALASLALVHRLKPSEARWIFYGACGLLAIAVTWRIASNLAFTDAHYLELRVPLWLRRSVSFTRDGFAPLALLGLVWWLSRTRRRRPGLALVALLAAAACCTLAPQTYARWTSREYPPDLVRRFAALRDHIPEGANVFWPESPVAVWLLLDRPSYLSVLQTSGMVFSRDSAFELERRAQRLDSAISPAAFMSWSGAGTGLSLARPQLERACTTGAFGYLVTGADLGRESIAFTRSMSGSSSKNMRVYECRKHAG